MAEASSAMPEIKESRVGNIIVVVNKTYTLYVRGAYHSRFSLQGRLG